MTNSFFISRNILNDCLILSCLTGYFFSNDESYSNCLIHNSSLTLDEVNILYYVFVFPDVFGDDVVTVMEGDKVILHTNITKQEHDKMLWYFEDTRIALINGGPNTSCLYDGEGGRFRDRLEVDYETGSLIITNITSEHAGRYEAEIIRSESSGKRQSLNRKRKCDSTKITQKISINHDDTIKTFNMIVIGELRNVVYP